MAKGTKDVAVGICLDESGSMLGCADATRKGFNDYLKQLRAQDGKTFVTLTQFSHRGGDDRFRVRHSNTPVKAVDKLTVTNYRPDGNTPLYDAIGHTITTMDEHLSTFSVGKRPTPIVVIQTDGFENASRDYSCAQIVKMIRKREKAGWLFVYLGADQDAVTAERASMGMGMAAGSSFNYVGQTAGETFASMGDSVAYTRRASASGQHVSSANLADTAKASYASRTGSAPEGKVWDEGTQSWVDAP